MTVDPEFSPSCQHLNAIAPAGTKVLTQLVLKKWLSVIEKCSQLIEKVQVTGFESFCHVLVVRKPFVDEFGRKSVIHDFIIGRDKESSVLGIGGHQFTKKNSAKIRRTRSHQLGAHEVAPPTLGARASQPETEIQIPGDPEPPALRHTSIKDQRALKEISGSTI